MWFFSLFGLNGLSLSSSAASADYPAQLMNIAVKDNSKILTENGIADGSALSVEVLGGDLSPSWRFDRVGSDANGTFFKLCNAESGRLLTPQGYKVSAGTSVIMYGSELHQSQHWYVIPVKNDHLGSETELEFDDDIAEYEISFYKGRAEYDYSIDAVTGGILEYDIDN